MLNRAPGAVPTITRPSFPDKKNTNSSLRFHEDKTKINRPTNFVSVSPIHEQKSNLVDKERVEMFRSAVQGIFSNIEHTFFHNLTFIWIYMI